MTRFNICTDTVHIYKKNKAGINKNILTFVFGQACTNGTDTVARGRDEGVLIIDIIINTPPPRIFEL